MPIVMFALEYFLFRCIFCGFFWAWPTRHANGPGWLTDLDINLSQGEAQTETEAKPPVWHPGLGSIVGAKAVSDTFSATQLQLCPRGREFIQPTKLCPAWILLKKNK